MKTKAEALRHLLWEYRRDKGSKTAYRKSVKAFAILGIEADAIPEFLRELGYMDREGNVFEVYR